MGTWMVFLEKEDLPVVENWLEDETEGRRKGRRKAVQSGRKQSAVEEVDISFWPAEAEESRLVGALEKQRGTKSER